MMVRLVDNVNSVYKCDEFTGIRSYSLKVKTEDNVMNFCLEICRQILFYSIGDVSVFFLNRGCGEIFSSQLGKRRKFFPSEINSYANECRF